jgi:porphobilinogen deaminase
MATLKLGTRGSQLALFQANTVASLLQTRAGVTCEIIVIKTSGDRLADAPLSEVGGKRLFVKEIEDALLDGRIDLAVHSSKDMPAVLPDGLIVGAVLPRADARDAIVLPMPGPRRGTRPTPDDPVGGVPRSAPGANDDPDGRVPRSAPGANDDPAGRVPRSAPGANDDPVGRVPRTAPGANDELVGRVPRSGPAMSLEAIAERLGPAPRIGTSSVRRTAQLTRLFPGARFEPIRGNLDTRLRKLDGGDYDALVLAAAGLIRLGYADRISATLAPAACVPAPGQGIIAVELRDNDRQTAGVVTTINDSDAAAALTAERAVVTRLGGGCQMPIGAYAAPSDGSLALTAIVISVDGSKTARADAQGPLADAALLGDRVAELLLAGGAGEILAELDRERATIEGLQP